MAGFKNFLGGSGSGITALTGDVAATGPGSSTATLQDSANVQTIVGENVTNNLPLFYVGAPKYATSGAIGVGNATADTAALTNAVNAAVTNGAGEILLPALNLKINSVPIMSAPTGQVYPYKVAGFGSGVSTLSFQNSTLATSFRANAPNFNTSSPTNQAPVWEGFTIDGAGASGTAVGIQVNDLSYLKFMDVTIRNYASSDGWYFYNILGWTEGVRMWGCESLGNQNAIHFAVASTGYSSFDYWWVDLYCTVPVNGNIVLEEITLGTPAETQHVGTHWGCRFNCSTAATHTGALFNLKGFSQWVGVDWDVHGETDGSGAAGPYSVIFGSASTSFNGYGTFTLLQGVFQNPSFAGGQYNMEIAGQLSIPGVSTNGTGLTVISSAGMVATIVQNQPSITQPVSGTAWVNGTGFDVEIRIPVTLTVGATYKFVQQNYAISAAGPTIITATVATEFVHTFTVHANEQFRFDQSAGSIGTVTAFWS